MLSSGRPPARRGPPPADLGAAGNTAPTPGSSTPAAKVREYSDGVTLCRRMG